MTLGNPMIANIIFGIIALGLIGLTSWRLVLGIQKKSIANGFINGFALLAEILIIVILMICLQTGGPKKYGIIMFCIVISAFMMLISFIIDRYAKKPDNSGLPQPPPIIGLDGDVYVTKEQLDAIMANLANFSAVNHCPSQNVASRSPNCDDLFRQLTDAKNPITYATVDAILGTGTGETGMRQDALKNQATHLIYQLIQSRLKLREDYISQFGTWEWFKENMVKSKFQIYVYVLALILCLGFFLYSFLIFMNPLSELSKSIPYSERISILIAIFFIIFFITIIVLTTRRSSYAVPVSQLYGGKYRPFETDPTNKNPRSPMATFSLVITLAIVIAGVIARLTKFSWIEGFFISLVLSAILVFNLYYMILIPQVAIFAILIQHFVLSTPLNDLPMLAIKVIIFVAVLFASLYNTIYKKRDTDSMTNPATGVATRTEGKQTTYNQPIWFLFGIILSFYLYNLAQNAFYPGAEYSGLHLVLMPLARAIIGAGIGGDKLPPMADFGIKIGG